MIGIKKRIRRFDLTIVRLVHLMSDGSFVGHIEDEIFSDHFNLPKSDKAYAASMFSKVQ